MKLADLSMTGVISLSGMNANFRVCGGTTRCLIQDNDSKQVARTSLDR